MEVTDATSGILVAISICFSFLMSLIAPVHCRKVAFTTVFINLIYVGGTWGAVSFLILSKTCFVVTELLCFTLFGICWKRQQACISAWIMMAGVLIALRLLFEPDAFSLVFGLGFGIYTRLSCTWPAILLTSISGVPHFSFFDSV